MAERELRINVKAHDQASGVFDSIGRSLEFALGGAILKLGELGIRGIGAAFRGTVGEGLAFNSSMEQVTAQLNAFTKDSEASAAILEMIRKRAASTPFAFEEMSRATAGLMPVARSSGAALEDLVAQAEILAASNPAQGLEGAAFSLREAAGGDFTSIIERFNLSRQTLNRLKEEGVPALEAVTIAMEEMGYDSSLVTNLSETMEGRMGSLQDAIAGLKGQIMAPIFDRLSAGLGQVTEFLSREDVAQRMSEIADAVGQKLAQAFDWLANTAIPAAITVFNYLKDNVLPAVMTGFGFLRDTVATIAQAFAGNWVDSDAVQPLHRLAGILGSLFGGGDLKTALSDLWDLVQDVFGNFADWIAAQLPGWIAALQGWAAAAWQWIVDAVPPLLAKAGEMIGALVGYLADQLPGWIAALLTWATEAAEWIGRAIPPLIERAGEFLAAFVTWAQQTALPAIVAKTEEFAEALFMWVVTKLIPEIGPKLMEFRDALLANIEGIVTATASAAKNVGKAIVDGIANAIRNAGSAIARALLDQLTAAWNEAKSFLGIQSPSRLFAGMGNNIALGLAAGILGEGAGVRRAVVGVLGDAYGAGPLRAGLVSTSAGMGGASSYDNRRSLVIQPGAFAISGVNDPDEVAARVLDIIATEIGG